MNARSATEFVLSGLTNLTSEDGKYVLSVKATDVHGTDNKRGVGVASIEWVKDVVGPSNAVWFGVDRSAVNYGYDALYLGFDEQIDFATLSRADLTLTRNGVNVPLDARLAMGILPESLKSTDAVQEWKLVGLRNFATEDGDYVLTVDLANVADLAGNLGSGRFSVSWTVDSEAPSLAFSQGINASSSEVALAGLASEENVVVRIYDSSDSSELFAGSYSGRDVAINLALPREGARNLRVRVTDAAGNWSDSELTARIDRTAPFVLGTSIEENVLSVRFSEPTNLAELIAGGSIVRAVSVLDDVAGTALDLPAAKFVYDAATKTLEIDLNSINVAGRETIPLTLRIDGSLVLDAAGNALKGSAATAGTPIRFALSGTVATANSYSVPSLVDWNGDGKLDLLVGEKSADGLGRVQVRLNTGSNAAPSYADPFYATYRDGNATVELTVPGQGCQGAAPRAVDVDGDGALDLFVGLADGTILFYRGQGTGANWPLTAPEFVTVGLDGAKSQLSVGSRAVFEVCDWDVDGRYDLLVGAGDGKLYVLVDSASEGLFDFRNALALTSANGTGELVLSAGRAAPTLADVDGDGKLDIVAGDSNGAFWTLLNVGTPANPRFESAVRLTDVDGDLALPNSAKRSRPFATDYDGDGAADLLVGSSDGNVYLYRGLKSASFNTDGESGGEFVCSVDWSYDANVVSEQLATPNMIKSLAKPTSITVKIGSVANATDYVVQYGTDPEFATYETATTQPGYFTASGLLSSTTYYFRVKATASGYKDSNWKELSVTTDKATLKAPEFAVDTTNTAIVVKIFSIEGADRYVMEYSTDPSFESGVVHKEYASSQIGSAKTFSKLTTLTTYYVRVKATGENFYDSAWTTASPIPGAPRVAAPTLSASATKSAVIVNIRAVDGAATYELQYSQDPDFTGATVKTYQTGGAKTFTNLPFGTTYYFRVKASGDGYNDSKRSTIEFAAGELSATTLKPSNVNYGSLDLAISVVANASSYALQYATDQNFTDPKTLTYSTYGTKSLSGLDPETTYYFRAKAIGDGVNRVDSKWSVVKTTTTKAYLGQLAAPTFTATATKSAIVVKLETPVENAAKYVVEFGTDSNFATCETRSYAGVGLKTISGLQTGATYYVRVKTTAPGYADSDYAATVKLIPGGATLATPTVALAQAVNTSLDLEIAEVANSTAYVVEYGTDETFATCETATFASAGVQTISGLTYGQTYFVRVKATSLAANDSKWSATLEARTTGIDAPTASVSTTKTAVVVKIGTVANASSYVVEYGTDPSYVGAGVKTYPTTGIKTISGLASGTTYYLRVKAVSTEFGESDWVELVAETKPDVQILAAPEITSVSTTKAAVTFRLNPVENATTYVVEYGTDPSFVGAGTKTYATTGAKTISGLVSGTTYFFRVKAIAEGFADSAWTTFDATTKPATTSSAVLDEEQEFFEESLATNGSELFAQSRGSANRSSGADFENYFEDDLEEFWDLLAKSAARSRNR